MRLPSALPHGASCKSSEKHGRQVFPPKKNRTLRRAFFGTLYDSHHLEDAIDECLGSSKDLKLKNLEKGLVVPAVDWVNGCTRIFVSGFMGKAYATDATLRELCLATSAAPTYFKPKVVDGSPMLDGGLSMNNPDVLALTEVARRWPERLAQLEMLSIGTAGADRPRDAASAEKAGLGWAKLLPKTQYCCRREEGFGSGDARFFGRRYLRIKHPDDHHAAFFLHPDVPWTRRWHSNCSTPPPPPQGLYLGLVFSITNLNRLLYPPLYLL